MSGNYRAKKFSKWLKDEELAEHIEPRVLKSLLKNDIAAMLEKRFDALSSCHDHDLEERFLAMLYLLW